MPKVDCSKTFLKGIKANNDVKLEFDKTKYGFSEITVHKYLGLNEVVMFVEDVVSTCFDEDSNMYVPGCRDFAQKFATITYYTNLELPDETYVILHLFYQTDLLERVIAEVSREQYCSIIGAVEEGIEIRNTMNTSVATQGVMRLLDKIDELTTGMEEAISGMDTDGLMATMNKLIKATKPPRQSKRNIQQKSGISNPSPNGKIITMAPSGAGKA